MMRRSSRSAAIAVKAKDEKVLMEKVENGSDENLSIIDAGAKGRGVCAAKTFHKGQYVSTYKGELISHREALKRCLL